MKILRIHARSIQTFIFDKR